MILWSASYRLSVDNGKTCSSSDGGEDSRSEFHDESCGLELGLGSKAVDFMVL
jgi:hypothetical protein